LKDAARLLAYFVATILLGALLAPILFWSAQWLAAHQIFPALAHFDFESFFHRALLIAAIALLWPLLRWTHVRALSDLQLVRSSSRTADVVTGFLIAAVPLLGCGAILIEFHIFSFRAVMNFAGFIKVLAATITVPIIEEIFCRGIVLGLLLRSGQKFLPIIVTSALYSIVHFLKAPERQATPVTWISGFESIANSFFRFADPIFVAGGFVTLFLIGCVLADARVRRHSLWPCIGLHAGWIFTAGIFSKLARQHLIFLPWLGKNLLVGIIPVVIVCLTWIIMRCCFKRYAPGKI
jgi:membrane protease YdiL (CAAX protease family)